MAGPFPLFLSSLDKLTPYGKLLATGGPLARHELPRPTLGVPERGEGIAMFSKLAAQRRKTAAAIATTAIGLLGFLAVAGIFMAVGVRSGVSSSPPVMRLDPSTIKLGIVAEGPLSLERSWREAASSAQ